MTAIAEHLIIAPILIPFFAGALMLLYGDRRRRVKLALGLVSALALLVVGAELLARAGERPSAGSDDLGTYLLGDWPTPFGIVLVHDRLSAVMLVLVALLAIPALIYSAAGWHRQGQHFHPLFQFLLMGLNGAFLTGDLFNLFVFFEVLLAASYGLLLHGSGALRVRAGLHYIAVNLTASLMFLIGVSLIYGVTGTLNMAHLAGLVPTMAEADRPLLHLGASFLGLAFLVKAGIWPLSFWLPAAYAAAAPPVAAMFAIMTKVGVYAVMRLSLLLFGAGAGPSAGFGAEVLIAGGMATVVFGLLGVLGSRTLAHMAAHLVLVSSGTVLAVTGFALAGGGSALLAGGLYYLVASTLASSALFLLLDPLSREQDGVAAPPLPMSDDDPSDVDDDEEDQVGLPIPGALAFLALCFGGCLLVLAGMPPLAGFVGKLAILSALLGQDGGAGPPGLAWAFLALLLVSGLATLIGLMRVGIRVFWATDGTAPRVWPLEIGPVAGLLAVICVMTIGAEEVMRLMGATSSALHALPFEAEEVLEAPRVEDQPGEGGMSRVLPHPILSVALALMWLILTRFTLGHLVLGIAVAVLAGWAMAALQPARPGLRRWSAIPRLLGVVAWDVLRSNAAVAWLILTDGRRGARRSGFLRVRLRLRHPSALALLAVIVTATPGTAWLEYDAGTGVLILHVFDLVDEAQWRDLIRNRYEVLLLEIFE